MRADRSRTVIPIRERAHGVAMGGWGLWLTIIVMVMFVAGLSAAPLYLETAQPRAPITGEVSAGWPPPGIALPAMGRAVLAIVLGALGAGLVGGALRAVREGAVRLTGILLLAGVALLAGSVVTIVLDIAAAPFSYDEHAYTSTYWILSSIGAVFLGTAVLMAAAVLVHVLTGVVDAERHLELGNATVYVWTCVALTTVLLIMVHVHPRLVAG
ncbi:MAG: hypothetical protein JJT89_12365 [Nitriliruptoraceae bacterium]|nr:hypothetical protein [Nitriliruptoraceae bacterium]